MTCMIRIDHCSAPPPPAQVLRRMLLDELSLTQAQLARAIGISRPRLNMILKGRCKISAEIALRVERVFGIPPHFWMHICDDFELFQERQRLDGLLNSLPLSRADGRTSRRLDQPTWRRRPSHNPAARQFPFIEHQRLA